MGTVSAREVYEQCCHLERWQIISFIRLKVIERFDASMTAYSSLNSLLTLLEIVGDTVRLGDMSFTKAFSPRFRLKSSLEFEERLLNG